jgi:PAS domain S-box-containing protein
MVYARSAQKVNARLVKPLAALAGVWALALVLAAMSGLRLPAGLGPDYVAMPAQAAGLMLGLSLALLLAGPGPGLGAKLGLALGSLVGLSGLGLVAGSVLGSHPGQLPPLSGAAILGMALAWLAALPGGQWRTRQAGAILALGPLGIGLVVLVSYAAGAPLRDSGPGAAMTLPGASLAALLSLAILFSAGQDTWPLALFGSRAARAPGPPSRSLRRGPMAGFLVLAVGILVAGTLILRVEIRAERLGVQEELAALGRAPVPANRAGEAEAHGALGRRVWNTGFLMLGLIALVALGIGLGVRHRDADRMLGLLASERERKVLAERSDQLMRHANDIILLTDLEGRILESNVAATEHFGYSPSRFRTLLLSDLRSPEHAAQLQERFRKLKAAGSARFESVYRRQDGTEFPAEISARVIDLGGESFVLHFAREITERKAAEAALRASEEKFSKAFDTSPDAININRLADGVYLAINPGFTRLTGYRPEDVLGRSSRVGDCNIWSDDADRERMLAELREHGEVQGFEARFQAKDGREIIGRMSAATLMVGDESCVLTTTRDVTQRRQADQERRELEARLHQAQKLESLGSLAGGVAHDMNNVLGAILSLASARREGLEGSDPMATALDTIATACERGRGVVRSLLYFARKDLEVARPLDLNDLVRDMVQLLGSTTLKRVSLEMELEEPLALIQGDSGALSHALMNLAVNALDAMPGHGTLNLRSENLPGPKVRLEVRDNGEGMPPEVLAKAIEPFFTTKPLGKGTGLGLAMVFGTVKAHGGDLELRSRVGEGTLAILTFPAVDPVPEAPDAAAAEPADAGVALTILVVDDDELIRESLVPMLEIMGHTARAASGGAEALDLLQGGLDVDLVILDMNMPGLNGAGTLARIKALRPGQAVLMASGYNDSEVGRLVAGHCEVSCIQKPFSMKELRHKLAGMAFAP